jgi:glutathione S-transferase
LGRSDKADLECIEPYRLGDILERRLAEVADGEIEPGPHLAIGILGRTYRARLGNALDEAAQQDRERRLPAFHAILAPLRLTLYHQRWLGGTEPSYADHIVAAAFMWPSCVSRFALFPADGPLSGWWVRFQDLYDGLAKNAVRI